ncbi:MAG TPA: SIMPL domain-containing protein [Mesorhizobium sp.]|jgi:hypothetical protein|nr:SIMPL domain-containing protein [Mesorhizobium sp.]
MKPFVLPLAAALALAAPSLAQAQSVTEGPRIVVTGEGEASLRPDLALLTLSVLREADTAGEALAQSSAAMREVIAALKAMGVADRDLQTSGLQIMPRYVYEDTPDRGQTSRLIGYQVVNTLAVRVRDIARVGEVIDKAVSLGVNQGGDVAFTSDDPEAALDEARKAAVTDATGKARLLSEAAGVKLGRVLEINDTMVAMPPVPVLAKAAAADAESTPIEPGENAYRVQVNMIFELN